MTHTCHPTGDATETLRARHLRMTRQRRVILEELRRTADHPSADELYSRVRRRLPRISLGTIYRNLEVLTELGEIQTLELCCNLKRFDGNAAAHYHIRCLGCGRVADAPTSAHLDLETCLPPHTDFRITGHKLEFVGLCPACDNPTPRP